MRLRVALKLLSREPPQSVALRRWRDPKGGSFMVPTPIAGDLMRAKAPIRAEAFEEASRELRSIERAPEAVAAYKRAAELLRAMAARERVL